MIRVVEFRGVHFIEGAPVEAQLIEPISTELSGFFSENQLKSLTDVKEKLRDAIIAKGGNCLTDFRYGQRSSFKKSWFAMDDVFWYASGNIARLTPEHLARYIQR